MGHITDFSMGASIGVTTDFMINAEFAPAPTPPSKVPLSKVSAPPTQPLRIQQPAALGFPDERNTCTDDTFDPAFGTFPESSPPSLPSTGPTEQTFPFCSPLNSLQLPNTTRADALDHLPQILSALSEDIDLNTDASDHIRGVVFVSNQCVHFAVYVYSQPDEGVCIEYRRLSGDSIASARFWTQMRDLLQRRSKQQFGSLTMDIDDLSDGELTDDTLAELPPLTMAAQEMDSDYMDSFLDQVATTFELEECYIAEELCCLYDAMATSYALCQRLWSHQRLFAHLIGALASPDISVVRSSILVLERLSSNVELRAVGDEELGHLCELLRHPRVLMRKYAIRLLAQFARAQSTEWKLGEETRNDVKRQLRTFGTQFADEIRLVSQRLDELQL